MDNSSVSLKKIIDEAHLEIIYTPSSIDEILISTKDLNRPGLLLSGFTEYFQNSRIQVLGNMEYAYLQSITNDKKDAAIDLLFSSKPPCILISADKAVLDVIIEKAKKYQVPVLRSNLKTSDLIIELVNLLTVELAPTITRHGVFVEIYGEGVLILGESGVGKSETAIDLVHRGHTLVADDAVMLKKMSHNHIVAASPENIRHFIEIRGIGIINVSRLFGVGSVKDSADLNLIINLELFKENQNYDRMGIEDNFTSVMGVDIPSITVPIKTGRNITNIIEIAVKNMRQKKMGYNSAQELLNNLGMEY